tara:strand:+ start:7059 stop:7538 length:480 start_codon:yes stop_codon:yes gene_type:complete
MKVFLLTCNNEQDSFSVDNSVKCVSKNLKQLQHLLQRIEKLQLNNISYDIKELILPDSDTVFIPFLYHSDLNSFHSQYFLKFSTSEKMNIDFYYHWISKDYSIHDNDKEDLSIQSFSVLDSLTKQDIINIVSEHCNDYQEKELRLKLISKGQYDFSLDH